MKALVVDDDPVIREVFRLRLRSLGHDVDAYGDAESAWPALEAGGFPLVILDWVLPGMDGLQLCRRFRALPHGDRSVVIVITAREGHEELQQVLDAGADDYLSKPVNLDLLGVRLAIAERAARTVAARRRAELALRESETRLGAVASSAPVLLFSVDADRRFGVAEGRALEAMRVRREQIVGRSIDVVCADYPEVVADLERALTGEAHRQVRELQGTTLELSYQPRRDALGDIRTVDGVAMDITERIRAEARLQEMLAEVERSRDDVVSILNAAAVGSAITDDLGRLTFVSRAALQLLDMGSEDELIGVSWSEGLRFEEAGADAVLREMETPADQRRRVRVTLETRDGHRAADVEVIDVPRQPSRRILFLYDVTEIEGLRRQLDERARFHDMVGRSKPMQMVFQQIRDIAQVDWTALIDGETGTGKELVARAIHDASHRRDRPFVAVNCAGLTDSLLSSQLFGHRRGAFTGAVNDQVGLFEAADGGTIFLDEIGDISKNVQTSLLRVLEELEITRLGESTVRRIDVRVIAATNRDLAEEVARGAFRADLLYRIRVARVRLPRLADRREDIPLLVASFLDQIRASSGREVELGRDALSAMMEYDWPGNVRELRAAVEYAVIRQRSGTVSASDLPPEIGPGGRHVSSAETRRDERERIVEAIRLADGHRKAAAEALGMSRATLYRRLSQYGIASSEIDVSHGET